LIGRTIIAVDFRVFQTGIGQGKAANPILTLDNGRKLSFGCSEAIHQHGIKMELSSKPKKDDK
jgi:hypothetical protein